MTIPEPRDGELAVWFQGNVPWVVMVRIDDYEDEEAPGERWFCADQYFTDSHRNGYGYTWEQVIEKFSHLNGPGHFNCPMSLITEQVND